jgi:hypothetical protein
MLGTTAGLANLGPTGDAKYLPANNWQRPIILPGFIMRQLFENHGRALNGLVAAGYTQTFRNSPLVLILIVQMGLHGLVAAVLRYL